MGHPIGIPAWNKGLKMKFSDKDKAKFRENMKIARKHLIFDMKCVYCGKIEKTTSSRTKLCDEHKGKISHKTNKPIVKSWQSKPNYELRAWKIARLETIKRDKGICQLCDKFIGKSIDVHHIDENGYRKNRIINKNANNNLNNLICLCHQCHTHISSCLIYKKRINIKLYKKLIRI